MTTFSWALPYSWPRKPLLAQNVVATSQPLYDLVRQGRQVTIYEATDYVGGLASGFKEPHWDWAVEKFYHHWFASDRHMLGLIDELGWSSQVRFPRPLTVVYHQGKFHPFDSIVNALLFPGLGWGVQKARFGLVGLYLRLTNNWRALEQHTVDAWMRRWAGNFTYELMWEPLMLGKFGEQYAKQVNMAWMWARIKARTTRLGTFEGGFQTFADRFAAHLRELGVNFQLSTLIKRVSLNAQSNLEIEMPHGTAYYDQCLVTTSPALLAQIAPDLPGEYLKGLLTVKSMGAVVMVLALKQQLSREGYYWYNIPKSAGFPFLAVVEHTNFVPKEKFGGNHIVIVNATSSSLRGEVPLILIDVVDGMTTCYDMAYGVGDTAFVAWAKRLGAARAEQGWGMLVEQAAEAFELWRGVRPDTRPVLEALKLRAAAGPGTRP